MLKAFELVPDAYRKPFRTWRKGEKQTHLEFACDLAKHSDCWCSALEVSDYDGLRELIVLEQLNKNALPEHIVNHVSGQKVKTTVNAAALADEYVLRNRRAFVERRWVSQHPRAQTQQTVALSKLRLVPTSSRALSLNLRLKVRLWLCLWL